jgi:hypothetical protein
MAPMKPCATCGHPWAFHVIPGGVDNIDIYPRKRECDFEDCRCLDYVEPPQMGEPQYDCQDMDDFYKMQEKRALQKQRDNL